MPKGTILYDPVRIILCIDYVPVLLIVTSEVAENLLSGGPDGAFDPRYHARARVDQGA